VRCSSDSVAGTGIQLNNVNGIKMTDCWFNLCGGDGMVLTTVFNSVFTALQVYGRNYVTPNGAGTDGIRFVSGCYTLLFEGCTFANWGRHGFSKSAIQPGAIRVSACFFNANGLAGVGYGLNDTGNSALHVVGCGFGGNAQGNGNMQGTFSAYSVCQLNSGAIASGAGPVTF